MATFPGSAYNPGTLTDGVDYPQAAHVNDLRAEVTAIENALLSGITFPVTSSTSVAVAELSVSGGSTFAGPIVAASTAVTLGSSSAPFGAAHVSAATILGKPVAMTLLYANSGTDANAAATSVDSIALTGLSAKDTLVAYVDVESDTQDTAGAKLWNGTDGIKIAALANGGAIAAGTFRAAVCRVRQSQRGATAVNGLAQAYNGSSFTGEALQSTFTTNWTAPWTLALRHDGVTAGGTFRYSWSVYKVAGQ